MIDDEIGPVNTDLVVVPAYGTPEAAIIQPERHAPLSLYAVRRWLPRLGAQRLALVLVLRTLAFDTPTASDGTRRITVSRETLADATGVANAGTVGEWLRSEPIVGGGGWRRLTHSGPEAEALARFVPRLRYAYSGKVRTGLIVCIRMDDPLAPEDEAAAERIRVGQQTAAASQLSFTNVPVGRAVAAKAVSPTSVAPAEGTGLPTGTLAKDSLPLSLGAGSRLDGGKAAPTAADGFLKAAEPLSVAGREVADPTSATGVKAAAATLRAPYGSRDAITDPAAGLKSAYPSVNVNDNGNESPSCEAPTGVQAGEAFLARAVRTVPAGLLSAGEMRRALAPLVAVTGQYLGDAGSDAFYAKAYLALYRAKRLDLAVEAMRHALDSNAERPGAVFTSSLKGLCLAEGISLGLKSQRGGMHPPDATGRRPAESDQPEEDEESPRQSEAVRPSDGADARLWQEARGELEAAMARSTFDAWLRNCELVAVRGEDPVVVVLAFPHQTACEWVGRRLRLTVERALTRVTGQATVIECVVAEAAAASGRR